MIVNDSPSLRRFTKLVDYLTLRLPQAARDKGLMAAHLRAGLTCGGKLTPKTEDIRRAPALAMEGLITGKGPKVEVANLKTCTAEGQCTLPDAQYNTGTDTITFDELLVQALEKSPYLVGDHILEPVALHELTHRLFFKIHKTNTEPKEVGEEFEREGYGLIVGLKHQYDIITLRTLYGGL